MNENMFNQVIQSSNTEIETRSKLCDLLTKKNCIPTSELIQNLGCFIDRQLLSRVLFLNEIYLKIIDKPGVIMEFGTRYGQNLLLFNALRSIYEPYNYSRKIIGFDTFEGFLDFDEIDRKSKNDKQFQKGSYGNPKGYVDFLSQLLACSEKNAPLSHIKKTEIIKGDVCETLDEYFVKNAHTIISLAFLDLDLYQPTKKVLQTIKNILQKGSVVVLDQLNLDCFPGETSAFIEVFGLDKYSLVRTPYSHFASYFIVE